MLSPKYIVPETEIRSRVDFFKNERLERCERAGQTAYSGHLFTSQDPVRTAGDGHTASPRREVLSNGKKFWKSKLSELKPQAHPARTVLRSLIAGGPVPWNMRFESKRIILNFTILSCPHNLCHRKKYKLIDAMDPLGQTSRSKFKQLPPLFLGLPRISNYYSR